MAILPQHLALLARFSISKKLLAAADVQSFDDTATRNALGTNANQNADLSGIGFHYRSPETNISWGWRVRLDTVIAGDNIKYLMDYGNRHLFFPPGSQKLLKDGESSVVIVEAEKSALALVEFFERQKKKTLVLGIGGCAGWQRKQGKKLKPNGSMEAYSGPSPDLDLISWNNRRVYIALDSNAKSNRAVQRERKKLAAELRGRGASIYIAEIPSHPNVNGPDDLIAEYGDEAVVDVFKEAEPLTDEDRRDLPKDILYSESGKILPLLANAITILRDEWFGVLGFNEFSLHIVTRKKTVWGKEADQSWTDTDDIRTADWLQHRGVIITPGIANAAIQAVAHESKFHPVRDYLKSLKWDNEPRIERWLIDYLGAMDTQFTRAIGKRWLISAVARIFRPGCQADHTLLLEGNQGIKKSTALRTLTGAEWFTDHISDLDSKDSRMDLHGKWIVELGELSAIRRSLTERVKSFLTATSDHFRPPYGRSAIDVKRQNVFAGSVNDENPFTDETGNRRFWPVRCGTIFTDKIEEHRDQIWAEAVVCYKREEPWWLDTNELNALAEEEQKQRYQTGVWDEVIIEWLKRCPDEITVGDVLGDAIKKKLETWTVSDKIAVSKCLKSNGWNQHNVKDGNRKSKRVYRRPASDE